MDKNNTHSILKERERLLNDAKPKMLKHSKTGKRDVAIIDKVSKIMRSNKSPEQQQKELQKLLKETERLCQQR